jgi:putative transposase
MLVTGRCLLRQVSFREIVERSMRHFDGSRYALDAFVVMPNHVHALVLPTVEWRLGDVSGSWKKFSARQVNDALNEAGPIWQEETYDHVVRDVEQLNAFRRYIESNPVKARLPHDEFIIGRGSGIST